MREFIKKTERGIIKVEAEYVNGIVEFWLLGCNNIASYSMEFNRVYFHQIKDDSVLSDFIKEICLVVKKRVNPEKFLNQN